MGTLNEDLSAIKEVEDKIIANKVARFAYTEEAYTTNDANGVAEYNVNNAQNIPTADASVLKVNETVLSKGYRAQASSVTRMLLNHFFGRMSYNLNKVNDNVSNLIATLIGHRGTADGFATLDENGRIPFSQLPESVIQYIGSTLLGRYWEQSNKTNDTFSGGARYANGIWAACSNNAGLWYSTDGKNWTQSNKADDYFYGGARYANGIWVACSGSATGLWYSTDGKNWTQSNQTNDTFSGGARYANGIWVACSGGATGLWYSTNGMNWTQSNQTDGSFSGGARYANGIWVACSRNRTGLWYSDVQTLIDNGWLK